MSSASIKTVGIIGLGNFGTFATHLLNKYADVCVTESADKHIDGIPLVNIQQVCQSDVVILAIPLEAYELVLPQVNQCIKSTTVLVDVCSVKIRPAELIARHLPNHKNILLTHPLFGPQSAATGTSGHDLIITSEPNTQTRTLIDFCRSVLQLNVQFMSAQQHDQLMAQVHALTFFVARGLTKLNLQEQQCITPSYKMILDLVQLDHSQSEELFKTVELGNPFAQQEIAKVVSVFENLAAELV